MWYNKVKLTHQVCSRSWFLMIYMFRFDKDRERIERQIQDWILCKVYIIHYIINRTWVTEMKMALMFHCGSCEKVFHRITITKVHITSPTVLLSMFSCVQKKKTLIAKLWLFKCASCNNPHSLYFIKY